MRVVFLMIFSLIFGLFSCQNESNITISAKLPLYKAGDDNGNPNQGNESNNENADDENNEEDTETGFKIPEALFEDLDSNNLITNFSTLTFNKQKIKLKITNVDPTVEDNYLSFTFEAWINAAKSQLLVLYLGLKNGIDNKYLDSNLMFAGGDLFKLSDKEDINIDISLKPVITVFGKVWAADNNKGIKSVINILPAKLKNKEEFSINLNKETQRDGSFNLKTIYGIFENNVLYKVLDRESLRNDFNVILIAKNEKGIGFTIVSKEENGKLNINNDDFKRLLSCYMVGTQSSWGDIRACKEIKLEDIRKFQSGNLLPGIKLNADIITYPNDERDSNIGKGVVTGVSSPRFALDLRDRNILDLMSGVYYGNFFISGFNLFKLIKSIYPDLRPNDDIIGKIRIYYDKEGDDDFYLQYKGKFNIYSIKIVKRISSLNPGVLQNSLPFYRLYNLEDEELYLDSVIDDGLDKDGNWRGRFLGIDNLRELKGKPVRVDFYYTDNFGKQKCKKVYEIPNEIDVKKLPSCDD